MLKTGFLPHSIGHANTIGRVSYLYPVWTPVPTQYSGWTFIVQTFIPISMHVKCLSDITVFFRYRALVSVFCQLSGIILCEKRDRFADASKKDNRQWTLFLKRLRWRNAEKKHSNRLFILSRIFCYAIFWKQLHTTSPLWKRKHCVWCDLLCVMPILYIYILLS